MLELLSEKQILEDYSLNQLNRYNTRTRITNESVASHTFFVCLFCLKLCNELNIPIEQRYEILVKALLHDIGESETSDIPHSVKAANKEIRKIFDELEENYLEDKWTNYMAIYGAENKLSYEILKLADIYSILQYTLTESRLGNKTEEMNQILRNAYARARKHIDKINNLQNRT